MIRGRAHILWTSSSSVALPISEAWVEIGMYSIFGLKPTTRQEVCILHGCINRVAFTLKVEPIVPAQPSSDAEVVLQHEMSLRKQRNGLNRSL